MFLIVFDCTCTCTVSFFDYYVMFNPFNCVSSVRDLYDCVTVHVCMCVNVFNLISDNTLRKRTRLQT